MTLLEIIIALSILCLVLGGVLAALMQSRRLTEGNEEVGKVLAEVAAVCEPLCGVKVQTRVQ